MPRVVARNWFNIGIVCQRLELDEEALTAYERAARMPDAETDMKDTARELKAYLSDYEPNGLRCAATH